MTRTEAYVSGGCGDCHCCYNLADGFAQRRAAIQVDADRQIIQASRLRDAAISLIPAERLTGTDLEAIAQANGEQAVRLWEESERREAARVAYVEGVTFILWALEGGPTDPLYAQYIPQINPDDVAGSIAKHLHRIMDSADRAWRAKPKSKHTSRAGTAGQPPGPDAGSSAARGFAAAPGHRSVPALDSSSEAEAAQRWAGPTPGAQPTLRQGVSAFSASDSTAEAEVAGPVTAAATMRGRSTSASVLAPVRWLGGYLYGNPRMPHRWAWMGVVFVSYTLVSWRMFRTLAIATPPGTTDPATLGPADPAVAPVLIVGALAVLLAVACTLAGRLGVWRCDPEPVPLPTPSGNGEPRPEPVDDEPKVPR